MGRPPLTLLFVIDGSDTMAEEQAAVAEHLPAFLTDLAQGDGDGDGLRDFDGPDRMHLGVVTSRMGTGGIDVPGCGNAEVGDDGLLRMTADGSVASCAESYPSFLRFAPGRDDPEEIARDLGCLAQVGTSGCAYPQPLEAALKAIAPSTSSIVFQNGTVGHGDSAHWGFVESALAVIAVTDRDDCSVVDPELFDPSSTWYEGDPTDRCTRYPTALHPSSRYAEGFEAAAGIHSLLAVIAGTPPELIVDPLSVDYDAVLAAASMQHVPDPGGPAGLRASCGTPDRGEAAPPRRLVETARAFADAGGDAVLASICERDVARAFDVVRGRIALLYGECMARVLVRDARGIVDCDLLEVLADGEAMRAGCGGIPGRQHAGEEPGIDGASRELCLVRQLAVTGGSVESGSGWYYDEFSREAEHACGFTARLAYTRQGYPRPGTSFRLECTPAAHRDPVGADGCRTIPPR
jgi:hypothetical protein